MRILGIDPGSRITGYGIVDLEGSHLDLVSCGCLKLGGGPLVERLAVVYRELSGLIKDFGPHEAAVEEVFMHRNAQSALKLGQARGAAVAAASAHGLSVHEYSSTAVKLATTGRGHAAKQQVQHMIRVLLCLDVSPSVDAADALAVAIAHGHYFTSAERVRTRAGSESPPPSRRRGRRRRRVLRTSAGSGPGPRAA